MVEDEYNCGFTDALELVNDYMRKYKGKIPEKIVLQIKESIQNFKDKKIKVLKEYLYLVDDEAPK